MLVLKREYMSFVKGTSKTPLAAWFILVFSIIAVSSAGAVFQMMEEIPPLLRASWRLQATSLVLLPFAIYQYLNIDDDVKEKLFDRTNILILIFSGTCLWLHFGSWVWSLDHTTLPRSLLFVTSHPLVIVVGMWIIKKPVNRNSTLGALIGFSGATIVILGVDSEGDATLIGDFAAFIGAVTVVGYFTAGRVLRNWMPLFLYAFPVTFLASILLSLSSYFFEGSSYDLIFNSNSILGWINILWLPYVIYLALGPGLVGHTGINAILKWFPPLIISVCLVMEPLIGSLIGYLLVSTETPGWGTLIGGILLIIGTLMVTTSQDDSSVVNGE